MTNNRIRLISIAAALLFGAFAGLSAGAQNKVKPVLKEDGSPALSNYFTKPSGKYLLPDENGFIRRWLILEPIDKPNRGNTVFVDSYLRENLAGFEYFSGQFTDLPKDGQKVKTSEQILRWHALDSKLFNVKLFRFATGQALQRYGVIFWAVTVINCDEDLENIRLAVGSNSASMWWLDGEEVLMMSGDRRMVMDDCASKRLTLKKGSHVLRGAVINGPGMSDFCARFIDEAGNPVRNITISNK